MSNRWHILTGEYPPQMGGVADYSRSVARGLAAAGDEVFVWAPQSDGVPAEDAGVSLHRLPGHFGPAALAELDSAITRVPGRLLLQYTPHAFGWKAMNVSLCGWLWARRQKLDVMFHEVAFPFERGQPWKHTLLATVHRGMAALLVRAAERVFVSIPGWEPLLRALAPHDRWPIWTPIPSNLPTEPSAAAIEAVRAHWLDGAAPWIVGHFGTYSEAITRLLEPALAELLTSVYGVRIALLGQGGPAFARAFIERHPEVAGRIEATGRLDAGGIAAHLAACDALLQPYPDGISTRRGSAMAGLALGRSIVTTAGHLTEPMWRAAAAVAIVPPAELARETQRLLAEPSRRAELGRRAATLYRAQFAVEHTIRALRAPVHGLRPEPLSSVTSPEASTWGSCSV